MKKILFSLRASFFWLLSCLISPPLQAQSGTWWNGGYLQPLLVFLVIVVIFVAYIVLLRWLRRQAAKRVTVGQVYDDERENFQPVELERYSRHIMLREIGGEGQRKLKQAKVAVVGAGGLGSPALLYLAAAGVGKITIIDDDKVELSNLQRQVIHSEETVGSGKVRSAALAMAKLNPYIEVFQVAHRLTAENAIILDGHDLVLDGSDSFATRSLVNESCAAQQIPLVSGAIGQWEGQVTVADTGDGSPCLACLFPVEPAHDSAPSCAEAGVMGALPGVIGAMMATEAIKLITGAGKPLRGEMLIYDALWGETRKIKYKKRSDCPVCGGAQHQSITSSPAPPDQVADAHRQLP